MANYIVALFAAIGGATWLYTKFMRRTGGNTKSSLTVALVCAVIIFFFVWSIMVMIDSAIGK